MGPVMVFRFGHYLWYKQISAIVFGDVNITCGLGVTWDKRYFVGLRLRLL